MNEQENLGVIQGLFAAFGRGDLESVLNALAEDVEWTAAGPSAIAHAGTYRGLDEVARFFQAVSGSLEFDEFEPQEFLVQGESVVVLGREQGRVRSMGREFENPWAMAFRLHGGKVARFRLYEDTAALAAASAT